MRIKPIFIEEWRTRRRNEQARVCDGLACELRAKIIECKQILERYRYETARLKAMK